MVKRILYNDGENMLAVTDDELIIIDDYAIKGLIRENQEIKARNDSCLNVCLTLARQLNEV
ncbi:MAG: hypothetical protein ACLTOM_01070, partial [Roseburia sp.]